VSEVEQQNPDKWRRGNRGRINLKNRHVHQLESGGKKVMETKRNVPRGAGHQCGRVSLKKEGKRRGLAMSHFKTANLDFPDRRGRETIGKKSVHVPVRLR